MGNGNCWVTPVGKLRKLSEALFRSKIDCMGRHLICISLSKSMNGTEDNILWGAGDDADTSLHAEEESGADSNYWTWTNLTIYS
jgi:hypothetical protein